MPNDDDFDIQAIDLAALTPAQWEALKQRLIRRAHAERSRVIGEMFAQLFDWLRSLSSTSTARPASRM